MKDRSTKVQVIDEMLNIGFRLPNQIINCTNPCCIFNTSALPYMYDGYAINGHVYSGITHKVNASKFKPHRYGLIWFETDHNALNAYIKEHLDDEELTSINSMHYYDAIVKRDQRAKRLVKKFTTNHIDYDALSKSFTLDNYGNPVPLFILCPCSHCELCLSKRVNDWSCRVALESESHDYAPFLVTLTYDDDHLPDDGKLSKVELQLFFKRLRSKFSSMDASKIKYVAVGEYGKKTSRPHYHIILFGLRPFEGENAQQFYKRVYDSICAAWSSDLRVDNSKDFKAYIGSRGHSGERHYTRQNGMVNLQSIDMKSNGATKYVTKYVLKGDRDQYIMLASKSLGRGYVTRHSSDIRCWMASKTYTPFMLQSKHGGQMKPVHFTRTMLDWICPRFTQNVPVELRRALLGFGEALEDERRMVTSFAYPFLRQKAAQYNKEAYKYKSLGLYHPIKLGDEFYPKFYVNKSTFGTDYDVLDHLMSVICGDDVDVEKTLQDKELRENYTKKLTSHYANEKKTVGDIKVLRNNVKKNLSRLRESAVL